MDSKIEINELEFFKNNRENEKLLVAMVEIKDSNFYLNSFGENRFNSEMNKIKVKIENDFKTNCFIYKEKKIVISLLLENNKKIRTQIKYIKRKFKKTCLNKEGFFDFLCSGFIIGIAFGKRRNILRNAHIALAYAKANQLKNTVYSLGLLRKIKNERIVKIEERLIGEAIVKGKVIPYYQKIIDNKSKEILKYEALARLHYQNKTFTPNVFLPTIKKLNLEERFTRDIVKKVFEDVYVFKKINASSININANDIRNLNTVKLIESLLKKYGGDKITFEIIETIGLEDYSILTEFTKTIKQYGATISIDDFGSGHSGYEHLINIDVDYLKIDGKFITEIKRNKKTQGLIKSLCDFSKEHNIKTVAEFVEDEETFLVLKKIGIDYSQGFFFGKPTNIK